MKKLAERGAEPSCLLAPTIVFISHSRQINGLNFFLRSIPITVFLCNGNLMSLLARVWKPFKGGNYSREKTNCGNTLFVFLGSISTHCVLTRPYHILKEHARIDDLGGNMITAHHTYVYPVARYVTCNLQPKIDKKTIFSSYCKYFTLPMIYDG